MTLWRVSSLFLISSGCPSLRHDMRDVEAVDLIDDHGLFRRLKLFAFQSFADINQHIGHGVISAVPAKTTGPTSEVAIRSGMIFAK